MRSNMFTRSIENLEKYEEEAIEMYFQLITEATEARNYGEA